MAADMVRLQARVAEMRRAGWTVSGIARQMQATEQWVKLICDQVDARKSSAGRAVFSTVDKAAARRA